MNRSAREMFENLNFKQEKDCYEHPLSYLKKRKTNNFYDVDEDSFAFYKDEKLITVWKDGKCVLITSNELQAIYMQCKELGWFNEL